MLSDHNELMTDLYGDVKEYKKGYVRTNSHAET